jgi:nitrogen fixation NifU-like protein
MEPLDDLFQEIMFDHYRRPRNVGRMACPPAGHGKAVNPSCGDEVEIWAEINSLNELHEVLFIGQGCAISQASASLMTVKLKGKPMDQVAEMMRQFHRLMQGEPTTIPLGDLALFGNVRKFPARILCSLVAWQALERALAEVLTVEKPLTEEA